MNSHRPRRFSSCPGFIRGLLLIGLGAGLVCAEPVRVVSQTVGTDELLLAIAEPEQIAALSHLSTEAEFSAVAKEAESYPHIGQGDAETILKFAPTLVLGADYSRAELMAQVERAGVEVMLFTNYHSLNDAYANLRMLAAKLGPGAEAKAEALIARTESRVVALADRLRNVTPAKVIAPSTYGVVGGAKRTFQDLCDHAAAENLPATLGGLTGHAPPPNEQMITWPVDFLVVSGEDLPSALAPFQTLPPYRFMAALRENGRW